MDELKTRISRRALELVTPVIEGWRLSYAEGGPMVRELERQFGLVQGQLGVAVANCTVGLEMVIRAMGLKGKRVAVPANGMAADALAVLNAGAVPVFVDVDVEKGCLEPEVSLHDALWSNDGCGAVLLVHIGALAPWSAEIARWCKERDVCLIEDCAHVMGDRKAGTFGDAAVYSMYATKVLPAGEGGIVAGAPKLLEWIRHIRMHGRENEWGDCVNSFGTNAKMSELNAAFGVAVLEHAKELIDQRLAACDVYDRVLGQGWFGSVGYKYTISPNSPEKVAKLSVYDVLSGPIFRVPLPEQPAFWDCECFGDLRGAEEFCAEHVCLSTDVTIERAEEIAKVVKEVCGG